jgi:hypothetical protein
MMKVENELNKINPDDNLYTEESEYLALIREALANDVVSHMGVGNSGDALDDDRVIEDARRDADKIGEQVSQFVKQVHLEW